MSECEHPDFLDGNSFHRGYHHTELLRKDLSPDPFRQFQTWLDEAAASPAVLEPRAMVLSTVSSEGDVSSRMILLKGFDEKGFRFFTNTGSRKAKQIASRNSASLLFYWEKLERQVQINGKVSQLPRAETEAYFARRPRGSCLGTWASRQSEVIPNRETLNKKVEELEKHFEGVDIPAPEFWSGFLVVPSNIEFWQGRPNRLHDRFRYRQEGRQWVIERLSP